MYDEYPNYKVAKKEREKLAEESGVARSRSRSRDKERPSRREEKPRDEDRHHRDRDERRDYRRVDEDRSRTKNPESHYRRDDDYHHSSSYRGSRDGYKDRREDRGYQKDAAPYEQPSSRHYDEGQLSKTKSHDDRRVYDDRRSNYRSDRERERPTYASTELKRRDERRSRSPENPKRYYRDNQPAQVERYEPEESINLG